MLASRSTSHAQCAAAPGLGAPLPVRTLWWPWLVVTAQDTDSLHVGHERDLWSVCFLPKTGRYASSPAGDFPHARYASFMIYGGSRTGRSTISDLQMKADPEASTPLRAWRIARNAPPLHHRHQEGSGIVSAYDNVLVIP